MGGMRPRICFSLWIVIPDGKHEDELWCIMGRPSLGTLAVADGAGLMTFGTSLRVLPVDVDILV